MFGRTEQITDSPRAFQALAMPDLQIIPPQLQRFYQRPEIQIPSLPEFIKPVIVFQSEISATRVELRTFSQGKKVLHFLVFVVVQLPNTMTHTVQITQSEANSLRFSPQ